MTQDQNDKKSKRPRIGEQRSASAEPEKNDHAGSSFIPRDSNNATEEGERQGYTPRQGGYNRYGNQGGYNQYGNREGYQPRQGGYNNNNRQGSYNRQGGYNRYNNQGGYNRYNNQGGYQQRPYQQRPYNNVPSEGTPAAEGTENTAAAGSTAASGSEGSQQPHQQRPYQQRPYQQRQGGYQQRPYQPRQGGYQQRQGGYQQRPYQQRQGGYNNNRQGGNQGGYQPRQGGYQQRPGGYQQRPGGYQQRPGQQRQRQNQYGMPYGGKSFVPRPKPVEYEVPVPDPDEQIRLNKYMANAGICSRREADEFIRQGLVKVNGEVVTELGTKISHSDTVEYDEKVVTLERKCYILLNKPKDCVTTSDDPNGRLTVMDIVKGACNERIYPVGRLDRNTTGVLLLTNDGDLASKLTHPKYIKKKIYHVWTDKDISEDDMQRIADGIELEDGEIHADAISYATETDRNQAGIEIHSGRNRIVRRIFEHLGYHVTKLDRVYFAGLTKKNLPRGRWRYLTQEEVNFLKMGSFE